MKKTSLFFALSVILFTTSCTTTEEINLSEEDKKWVAPYNHGDSLVFSGAKDGYLTLKVINKDFNVLRVDGRCGFTVDYVIEKVSVVLKPDDNSNNINFEVTAGYAEGDNISIISSPYFTYNYSSKFEKKSDTIINGVMYKEVYTLLTPKTMYDSSATNKNALTKVCISKDKGILYMETRNGAKWNRTM